MLCPRNWKTNIWMATYMYQVPLSGCFMTLANNSRILEYIPEYIDRLSWNIFTDYLIIIWSVNHPTCLKHRETIREDKENLPFTRRTACYPHSGFRMRTQLQPSSCLLAAILLLQQASQLKQKAFLVDKVQEIAAAILLFILVCKGCVAIYWKSHILSYNKYNYSLNSTSATKFRKVPAQLVYCSLSKKKIKTDSTPLVTSN